MTQTVPATAVLGPGATGLTIGLRVLNLDGTEYSAFSTTDVAETSTAGTYRKAGGVVAPLAGGYIVWGTALVDYAEATVESTSANVTQWRGEAVADLHTGGRVDVSVGEMQYGVITKQSYDQATAWPLDEVEKRALEYLEAMLEIGGFGDSTYPRFISTAVEQIGLRAPVGTAADGSIIAQLEDLDAALAVVDSNLNAVKLITDTLDVSAVTQVAASSAGHLTITAGLTFGEAVTGLTIPADWAAAVWTLKHNAAQADTAAVIQLRVTNPADGDDGLQRLNGAAVAVPITATDGTLTVTQASGRIDIYLSDELTLLLAKATGLGWDIKFIDADGDSSGRRGTADVVLTETQAVT